MNPLTLYPHEIRRLLDTGSVTVWRPMKPQPPEGEIVQYGEYHPALSMASGELRPGPRVYGAWADDWDCLAPHPPGSERWVKERFGWAVTPKGTSVIVYQADNQARHVLCDNEGEGDCVGVGKKPVEYVTVDGVLWKSAQRMPRWASRLAVVSREVQARQVETVTEVEAEQTGVHPGGFASRRSVPFFREWWQSRYGTWNANPWAWATTLERKER